MRPLVFATLLFVGNSLLLGNPVDDIATKYGEQESSGVILLCERQIEELKEVGRSAMKEGSLELANRANERIKIVQKRLTQLRDESAKVRKSSPMLTRDGEQTFPSNKLYKMTSHSGGLWTEKGKKIVCNFESLIGELPPGKLTLVVQSNDVPHTNTNNKVRVLNGVEGRIIGEINGLARNKRVKIPLNLEASNKVEIAIAVGGGDALGISPYKGTQRPEVYLTIE